MNAKEIIEHIKALTPEEREEVFAFVRGLPSEGALREGPGVRYMDAGKAKEISGQIFSERAELFRKLAS
jgi:hypothetical protein